MSEYLCSSKTEHEIRAELPSEVFDAERMTIPAPLRKQNGIKGGSKVAFDVTPSGAFLLKPVMARGLDTYSSFPYLRPFSVEMLPSGQTSTRRTNRRWRWRHQSLFRHPRIVGRAAGDTSQILTNYLLEKGPPGPWIGPSVLVKMGDPFLGRCPRL